MGQVYYFEHFKAHKDWYDNLKEKEEGVLLDYASEDEVPSLFFQESDLKARTVACKSFRLRYPSARIPTRSVMINVATNETTYAYVVDTNLNLYPNKKLLQDQMNVWPEMFEYGYVNNGLKREVRYV